MSLISVQSQKPSECQVVSVEEQRQRVHKLIYHTDWNSREGQLFLTKIIRSNSKLAEAILSRRNPLVTVEHVDAAITTRNASLTYRLFQAIHKGALAQAAKIDMSEQVYKALLCIIKQTSGLFAFKVIKNTNVDLEQKHLEVSLFRRDRRLISTIYERINKEELTPALVYLAKAFLQTDEIRKSTALVRYCMLQGNVEITKSILSRNRFASSAALSLVGLARELKRCQYTGSDETVKAMRHRFPNLYPLSRNYNSLNRARLVFNLDALFFIRDEAFENLGSVAFDMLFYAQNLLSQFSEKYPDQLPEDLLYAFDFLCDSELPIGELEERVSIHRKPIIIPTGWKGHRTYIAFYKGIMVKCNRGDKSGDRPGVQVFSIDESELTADVIAKISEEQDPEYFLSKVDEDLNAKELCYLPQKGQKSGNCAWASAKSAIYGTLFMIFYDKNLEIKNTKAEAIEAAKVQAKEVYKRFTRFARETTLSSLISTPRAPGVKMSQKYIEAQEMLQKRMSEEKKS